MKILESMVLVMFGLVILTLIFVGYVFIHQSIVVEFSDNAADCYYNCNDIWFITEDSGCISSCHRQFIEFPNKANKTKRELDNKLKQIMGS